MDAGVDDNDDDDDVVDVGVAPADESTLDDPKQSADDPGLPPHLKDVGALARWSVSSHKPGCGVDALRHPSTAHFWQSDGPQPHHLSVHFVRMLSVVRIRVFLDYSLDESYTPTKLQFLAGTGYYDLCEVCTMSFQRPAGWVDVDLSNAGGPPALEPPPSFEDVEIASSLDRDHPAFAPSLRCMLLQVRILENMQNGKDTHLRGLRIFAVDDAVVRGLMLPDRSGKVATIGSGRKNAKQKAPASGTKAARRKLDDLDIHIDEMILR